MLRPCSRRERVCAGTSPPSLEHVVLRQEKQGRRVPAERQGARASLIMEFAQGYSVIEGIGTVLAT